MEGDRIRRLKEKISLLYLEALATKMDLSFDDHKGKDKDIRFGIDCTVSKGQTGINRAESLSSEVNFQSKGTSLNSTTMVREERDYVHYNLSRNLDPAGNFYLSLLVLPPEADLDGWILVDGDQLIMKARAYFLKLDSTNMAEWRSWVKIPKTNLLTPQSLHALLINPAEKEDI